MAEHFRQKIQTIHTTERFKKKQNKKEKRKQNK